MVKNSRCPKSIIVCPTYGATRVKISSVPEVRASSTIRPGPVAMDMAQAQKA